MISESYYKIKELFKLSMELNESDQHPSLEDLFNQTFVPQNNESQNTTRQVAQIVKLAEFMRLTKEVKNTLIHMDGTGEPVLKISFKNQDITPTQKMQSKGQICRFRPPNIKIYYLCQTCFGETNLALCQQCFIPQDHVNHKYIDIKDDQTACVCGTVYSFDKKCSAHYSNISPLPTEKEQSLYTFYQQCFELYLILLDCKFPAISALYHQRLFMHLILLTEGSSYYAQIIEKIFRTQNNSSYSLLQMLMIKSSQKSKNLMVTLFNKCITNESFYQLGFKTTFKLELTQALFQNPLYHCCISIKIIAKMAEESTIQVSPKFLERYLKIHLQNIQCSRKIPNAQLGKYLTKIYHGFSRRKIFDRLNGTFSILSVQTKKALLTLAEEKQEDLFFEICRKLISHLLTLSNNRRFVVQSNQLFKRIYILAGSQEKNIPLLFVKHNFEKSKIQSMIKQYICGAIEYPPSISLLTLRSLSSLVQAFQLSLFMETVSNDIQCKLPKFIEFIKAILGKQCGYASSVYRIRAGTEKNKTEFQKNIPYDYRKQEWLKDFIFSMKKVSSKQLWALRRYINIETIEKVANNNCLFNEQSKDFTLISQDFRAFNPDFLIQKLLKLSQLDSMPNLKVEVPDFYQQNPEYTQNSKIYYQLLSSHSQKKRFRYLSTLFGQLFSVIAQTSSIQDSKNLFQSAKVISILCFCGFEQFERLKGMCADEVKQVQSRESVITQLLGINCCDLKKQAPINQMEIQENGLLNKQQNTVKTSLKAVKMKKLKQKFNQRAKNIRSDIIRLHTASDQKDEPDIQKNLCIVCRETELRDNPLYYLSKIQTEICINKILKQRVYCSITSCFHMIHFECFSGYIAKKKEKCPLCTASTDILLPEPKIQDHSMFLESPAFVKFFEKQAIKSSKHVCQIFMETLLFNNGLGLFEKKKKNQDALNNEYFLNLIGELFKTEEQYLQVLEEVEDLELQKIEKNNSTPLKLIERTLITYFFSLLRNSGLIIKKAKQKIQELLDQLLGNFGSWNETALFISHMTGLMPEITLKSVATRIHPKYRVGVGLFINLLLPKTLAEAYSWRQKCLSTNEKGQQCSRLKAELCLICNQVLCEFCESISDHNQSHKNCSLFLSLENGHVYFYTNNSMKKYRVYDNKLIGTYVNGLDKFLISERMFNQIKQWWMYSLIEGRQKSTKTNQNQEDDW